MSKDSAAREVILWIKESFKARRIKKIRKSARIEPEIGAYWIKDREEEQGPYCTCCLDKDGKIVHLVQTGHLYRCDVCGARNSQYRESGYRKPRAPGDGEKVKVY